MDMLSRITLPAARTWSRRRIMWSAWRSRPGGRPAVRAGDDGPPPLHAQRPLTGGVAPARTYVDVLLPVVPAGRIEPGRVLDRTVGLDQVPGGYHAMADREALKILVRP
ncbi:hypothetical protein [Streptomyces atratus]|uniref:hypothetical protein n=1 Tax=Streptomyces atratus TaxID=1893 RepID=UPI0013006C89